MPFGLCNAPATFQRLMDAVLAGLQWSSCLVYMDDIVIPEVNFLGRVVSVKGIQTDPQKTKQVSTWPTPSSQREVQQFLGLASCYHRFVKNFATISNPLYRC